MADAFARIRVPNLVRRAGNHIAAARNALTDSRVPNVANLAASNVLEAFAATREAVPIEAGVAGEGLGAYTVATLASNVVPILIGGASRDVGAVRDAFAERLVPNEALKAGRVLDALTLTVAGRHVLGRADGAALL